MSEALRNTPPLLCYVDESGDTSLNPRSSHWFFLSACIVRADRAQHVSSYIEEAKEIIWRAQGRQPKEKLDWKGLTHPQRGALLPIFTSRPYTQIIVGMWCSQVTRPQKLQEANWAYRYACRYLIERISWFARDNGGFVRITFSKTDRLNIAELKKYIGGEMALPSSQIANSFNVDDIRESTMSQTQLLMLADNAASSFAAGFNPDSYGVTYPHHTAPALNHLYSYGRRGVWTYGFKTIPNVNMQMLKQAYPFTNSWF